MSMPPIDRRILDRELKKGSAELIILSMLDAGARYLPVMQDSKLIGVISFRDVAKAVLEEQDFENKMLKGYIKNWPA